VVVDRTRVGFVAHMTTKPTSVAIRGALALGGRTPGEFVGHMPTNSPLVPAEMLVPSSFGALAASRRMRRADEAAVVACVRGAVGVIVRLGT
jgi:hypothetical protein